MGKILVCSFRISLLVASVQRYTTNLALHSHIRIFQQEETRKKRSRNKTKTAALNLDGECLCQITDKTLMSNIVACQVNVTKSLNAWFSMTSDNVFYRLQFPCLEFYKRGLELSSSLSLTT